MPSIARRTAVLLVAAIQTAFWLLAPAPQFHQHCGDLHAAVRCHVAGQTSLTGALGPGDGERDCPACTISGLTAVPFGAVAVAAPADSASRTYLAVVAIPRSPFGPSRAGRGPPTA